MQKRRYYYTNISGGRQRQPNFLWGALAAVFVLVTLFFLARFIFRLLYFLSPVFLIATAIIDHKVIVDFVRWIAKLFKDNWVIGLVATVLTIFGFPLVSVFLLGRALFNKRLQDAQREFERQTKGEEVDYEELDTITLELDELKREQDQARNSRRKSGDSDPFDSLF